MMTRRTNWWFAMRDRFLFVRVNDRAVSEVVGFILVFSIVLATITIVYVGGFSGLTETRDAEQMNNAERAFDVFANNVDEMARNQAPTRATEIKLSDARLSTTSHKSVSTNATWFDGPHTAGPVGLVYDAGTDTQIVYEHGAVIRVDPGGAVMLREPDFIFDERYVVIRYIETRGADQTVQGSTTVLVRSERTDVRLLASESTPVSNNVTFRIETDEERAEIWKQYLDSEIHWETDSCDIEEENEVVCEFEIDEDSSVHISRTRIRLQFA